jgi:uncharacterized alpha-E superfamily protein
MARYMERAENLARILDVHETFSRDSRGARQWSSIVQINADEKRFFSRHMAATAHNVVDFYVLDTQNPNSIVSAVRAARENSRTLRPLISTEMWTQINVFYNRLLALGPSDIALHNLPKLCTFIKESCQAHTGIIEGTFYRDQGWYFYQLGKYIERADQTTRLLDIKYHLLLRSAAGYHAFRRVYPRGMTPAAVAGFLLYNESFPRSVSTCIRQVDGLLVRLKSRYMLRGGNRAMERVDEIQAALHSQPVDVVIQNGLHEHLDFLQYRLIDVTREIGAAFFGQKPAEALAEQ